MRTLSHTLGFNYRDPLNTRMRRLWLVMPSTVSCHQCRPSLFLREGRHTRYLTTIKSRTLSLAPMVETILPKQIGSDRIPLWLFRQPAFRKPYRIILAQAAGGKGRI